MKKKLSADEHLFTEKLPGVRLEVLNDAPVAVRNAILDATGVAIDELPFTPERVWRALHDR